MKTEIENLRSLCSEVYQIVGALALVIDRHADVTKTLDNLAAAARGVPLPHETLLPFVTKDTSHG